MEGEVVLVVVCPVDEVFAIVELALGVALVEVGGIELVLNFVGGELFGEGDEGVEGGGVLDGFGAELGHGG